MQRILFVVVGLVSVVSCTQSGSSTQSGEALSPGAMVLQSKGCLACHSVNGAAGIGPTFKGLYGKTETLADGSQVAVDDAYIRESIRQPNAKLVRGYQPAMPALPISDEEIATLISYFKTLK